MITRYTILAALALVLAAASAYFEAANDEPEAPTSCEECQTDHECEALCPRPD